MDRFVTSFAVLAIGLLAGNAGAQTNASSTTSSDASTALQARGVHGHAHATSHTEGDASLASKRERIAARAAAVSAHAQQHADARLQTEAREVDRIATRGEAQVAGRLAADFGMLAGQMTSEKHALDASWGNLMIAHTLAANASAGLTASDLIEMKRSGMGWGQIAAGMGFKLGSVTSAVKAETKVAQGVAKADGHVAMIRAERERNLAANAEVATRAGADAHHERLGVGASAGVGVKIGR